MAQQRVRIAAAITTFQGMPGLYLSDAEAEALIQELNFTINYARYPFSHRIQTLRAIPPVEAGEGD